MGTEASDASASLFLDVGKRKWAESCLGKLNLPMELLTELGE